MRKNYGRLAGFLACLTVLVLASGAEAATAFRLSNQFPASHHISKGLVVFAEKVNEYSNGGIECRIFDNAQLYKDTEIVDALQENLIDSGLVPTNKWSGMIPAIDIFDIPFVFKDLGSIKKFLDGGAAEILDKECEARGVKNLFWVDYGYIQFFNNKRPVRMPSDMKGLTMRSFSASDAETLQLLGAAPTVMSSGEMYMALQRGTVDGATTGMPAAVSRRIFEVQKHMTLANYSTAQFVLQGNLKWWNSLSTEQKDVITKAGLYAEAWIRDAIAEAEDEAQQVIIDSGTEIYSLSDKERREFQDTTAPARDIFTRRTGELGVKLLKIADSID